MRPGPFSDRFGRSECPHLRSQRPLVDTDTYVEQRTLARLTDRSVQLDWEILLNPGHLRLEPPVPRWLPAVTIPEDRLCNMSHRLLHYVACLVASDHHWRRWTDRVEQIDLR
jgi:hypothetical protein